jgi:hypothetical protein
MQYGTSGDLQQREDSLVELVGYFLRRYVTSVYFLAGQNAQCAIIAQCTARAMGGKANCCWRAAPGAAMAVCSLGGILLLGSSARQYR